MPEEQETPAETQKEKMFTQADLDRIIADRVARAKPDDYDDLKQKAERFDAAERERMSREEQLQADLQLKDSRIAELERAATRSDVARVHEVDPDLLVGSTKEELEASAKKLLAFVEARGSKRRDGYIEGFSGGGTPPAAGSEQSGRDLFEKVRS